MIPVYKEIAKVDILAFGIHPDDVELSASGTLLHHMNQGYRVGICDLTKGELGSRGNARTRLLESQQAAELLGVDWRVNLELADGFSTVDKNHILALAEVIRLAQPKIILANAIDDRHPDHPRGAQLAREAFFFSGLSKIDHISGAPHRATNLFHYIQDKQLTPDFIMDITPYIDQKMASIKAYTTQFYQVDSEEGQQTPISSKQFMDFMLAKMKVYGRSIQAEYAEGFNVHRTMGLTNLIEIQ